MSTGNKLLIKPSKEAVKKSMRQISNKVHKLNGQKIGKVIHILNPITIGKENVCIPK